MAFTDNIFRRRFSVNLYRNLSLPLSEMSFYKDWVNDRRGDPYPSVTSENAAEKVGKGVYSVCSEGGGTVKRLLGSFFPYASYELTVSELENSAAGFSFENDSGFCLEAAANRRAVFFRINGEEKSFPTGEWDSLSFSFRPKGVSVYTKKNGEGETLAADVDIPELSGLLRASEFRKTRVCLLSVLSKDGKISYTNVSSRITSGISQADIKPVRYENGEVMVENGRVFLTASLRQEVSTVQGVLSWCPSTSDFRLEGVIFFDCGDGKWSSDVAVSLIFDRTEKRWIYWMCAFSHGHILGRGSTVHDPRFGVNLLSVKLMEPAESGESVTAFKGFGGDEDPDIIYHKGKWYLAICRLEGKTGYHYHRFVSDNPFDGFEWLDRTPEGEKTGGLFAPIGGQLYFICGSDFKKRAVYDVYKWNDFGKCEHLKADFDDGGFRGWGTVMEIPCGSEVRTVWITFDRHNGSSFNWSYGNLYVFDMD